MLYLYHQYDTIEEILNDMISNKNVVPWKDTCNFQIFLVFFHWGAKQTNSINKFSFSNGWVQNTKYKINTKQNFSQSTIVVL